MGRLCLQVRRLCLKHRNRHKDDLLLIVLLGVLMMMLWDVL